MSTVKNVPVYSETYCLGHFDIHAESKNDIMTVAEVAIGGIICKLAYIPIMNYGVVISDETVNTMNDPEKKKALLVKLASALTKKVAS